jgi:hypothetical protein
MRVLPFKTPPLGRLLERFKKYGSRSVLVLGSFAAAVLVFQLFFRYQYIDSNGRVLRVDRLTQETCQVAVGQARCSSAPASTSTSVKLSTSVSTSLSLSPSRLVRTNHK